MSNQKSTNINPVVVALICVPVLLMVILDTTVVDVIIPHIMAALSVDYYDVQWVVIAYMVAAAVVMPAFDWLSSRFSYKTLFITGTLLFVLSSISCGKATTFEVMVLSRILQGAGEGIVVPTVTSMVFLSFPPEKRGLAMGLIGLGATMGPALGPTVGGYVTEHISWRWAFYINVPIGFTLATAAFLFLPELSVKKAKKSFDVLGFSLCTVFLSSFLIAVSKGQEKQWFSSDFILYLFIIAAISFVLFIWVELKIENPFVQLRVFKYRLFSTSMLIRVVFGGAIYGSFFLVPIYCEKLRMYPTFTTGLIMLPGALTNGLGTVISGRLADKFDPRKLLFMGLLLMAYALYRVHFLDEYTPKEKIAVELIFFFLFIGATFTPLNYISLVAVPEKYTDVASSMIHVIRFIAGSVGTALATNRFEYMSGYHFLGITSKLHYGNLVFRPSMAKLYAYLQSKAQVLSQLKLKTLAALKQVITLKSYIYAFQDCMILFMVGCLLASCLVFLMPKINKVHREER
ncbi:MFS transporter, DHA2 family, multidrug resistance protein B [Thermosulfidibacter takaii ABI70S6]|uniref:MFS transporter, DHA2 family, multidrug resistance protein B n=1 Tax=Thermosulfidibacter takaii (strain DSM 17441 / JCM 13301 / NBRC 103674 / ABI70S6) TaxID=1298851 RepID=A0A0S3QUP2_THET7|nr:DHA2 family efflux MFS transporter permease subunit [Thermosulfidibacter takaii]BAT72033.1 MFS transporter, DHA2 family, multidrug resistance protein B [Thermosulfidibacter takaii ABI70S6]